MKTSLILTVVILIAGILTGLWQRRGNDALRVKREALKVEAARLGVDPRWLEEEKGTLSPVRTMQLLAKVDAEESRVTRDAETRAFARELAAFAAAQRKMREAGEQPDAETQKQMVALMERLMDLREDDFRVLLDEFHRDASVPPEARAELTGMTVMMLAQQNPRTALGVLLENKEKLKDNPGFGFMAGMCLQNLARTDPKAALDWLDQNKDSDLVNDTARQQALAGVAAKDPELALRRLLEQKGEDGEDPNSSVTRLAGSLTVNADPDALLTALRKVTSENEPGDPKRAEALRFSVLMGLGSRLAQGNIAEAKTWLESGTLNETEKGQVLEGVGNALYGADPAPWLELMRTNLPEEKMTQKLQQIIPNWTRRDFNAVGEWLNAQPAGKTKEQAVLSFAGTLHAHEPEAARRWLDTLPDSDKKREILQQMETAPDAPKPVEAEAVETVEAVETE